jgi:nucleotide-binding universal stress UspA family protein
MTRNVVVGIDGSKASRAALEWAIEEARLRHAPLEVVHAWEYPMLTALPTSAAGVDAEALERAAEKVIEEALEEVDTSGVTVVANAFPAAAPLALMERSDHAAMLVVGSRGRGGFRGLLLGSVSQAVVSHARCPVVVVRGSD